MPRELRHIVLSRNELTQALEAYRRMTATGLPDGTIVAVEPDQQHDLKVVLTRECGSAPQQLETVLAAKHIVPMLVRFCYENNIPLPMNGKKAYRTINGELALVVRIDDVT